VLTVDVVSHRLRRRTKIRLGLLIAGLAAAGAASLPTLLGPDASAGQPPPFTSNPTATSTAKPTGTTTPKPPVTATSPTTAAPAVTDAPPSTAAPTESAPTETPPKPTASTSHHKCVPDYTDNNWCPPGQ
jgi:hypothetical protein